MKLNVCSVIKLNYYLEEHFKYTYINVSIIKLTSKYQTQCLSRYEKQLLYTYLQCFNYYSEERLLFTYISVLITIQKSDFYIHILVFQTLY